MTYVNRVITEYMNHYNKLFWLFFAIAGAIFILSTTIGWITLAYLDLALGMIIIAAGVHRIGDEFFKRRIIKAQTEQVRSINELLQWAEKSYDYTRAFKDRHEKRLHRLDVKRALHEDKTEEQFRDAVRKIIQMENRLNKVIRPVPPAVQVKAPGPTVTKTTVTSKSAPGIPAVTTKKVVETTTKVVKPRLSDLDKNQSQAIKYLRKEGKITNKQYRNTFKVSDKKAYNDLVVMYNMGLIKRKGKGRNTHYVLAF
jgi:hypothetical protein